MQRRVWDNQIGRLARRGARHGLLIGAFPAVVGLSGIYSLLTDSATFGQGIARLLVGLGGAWIFTRFLPRLVNVEETPEIKALASRGVPVALASQIEEEIQTNSRTLTINRVGTVTITPSWFVRKRFLGLDLVPLSDIVWAFERVTQHYNWFIPAGKSRDVIVRMATTEISFTCLKGQANEILVEIGRRAPHVLVGWHPDIDALWQNDKPALIRRAHPGPDRTPRHDGGREQ